MNLGNENVILGLPWLKELNPTIDWVMKTLSIKESLNQFQELFLLRLTQREASVDLKRQRDDEFLKGFFKSKDAGGFHSYSWQ